jgi:hypothetical protein
MQVKLMLCSFVLVGCVGVSTTGEGEGDEPSEGEGDQPSEGEGDEPSEGEGDGSIVFEGEGEDGSSVNFYTQEQLNAVAGTTSFQETQLVVAGSVWDLSPLSALITRNMMSVEAPQLVDVVLPSLTTIKQLVIAPEAGATRVSLPSLVAVASNGMTPTPGLTFNASSVIEVDLPLLTVIPGLLGIGGTGMTTLNMPAIESIDSISVKDTALTTFSLPTLTSLSGLSFESARRLESISLPQVESLDYLGLESLDSLTTIDMPNLTRIGALYYFGVPLLSPDRLAELEALVSP